VNVTRRQVLAYRALMSGLGEAPPHDALLDLGVQDTPAGAAAQALAVRGLDDEGLTPVWSFRGAPHLHRSRDLPWLAAAAWPLSDADAAARLAGFGTTLVKQGGSGLDALTTTAKAVRAVVTKPTAKGDLSAAVTKRIPDAYSLWCRGCGATHVHDQLLRLAALGGGVRIVGGSPLTFGPIPKRPPVPRAAKGTERLVTAYLTLHGPARPGDAAAFLGTGAKHVEPAWPEGLAEVRVDGAKRWLPEDALDALRNAEPPEGVRLLPPSDPYVQARDRDLLVPDKGQAKRLWTVLAGPGAVLHDGEVRGVWRAKQGGKGRLDVTVTEFAKLPRGAVTAEAERVAALRGAGDVHVTYAD
jgi:hypothetical protein